jgi:hypothetical protein
MTTKNLKLSLGEAQKILDKGSPCQNDTLYKTL